MRHEALEGLPAVQNVEIKKAFKLLKDIDVVIEIGTQYGGFAVFLRTVFPDAQIFTFDISDWKINGKREAFKKHSIKFEVADAHAPDTEQKIKGLINRGRALVCCDGGHKINEFTMYAKHLKAGDYIGAHDYGIDRQAYDRIKEDWTGDIEVQWSELSNFCINNKLKRIHREHFERALWLMCEKRK